MRGSVRKRKFQWNLEEKSPLPTKISQSNTWHQSQGDTSANGRIGSIWCDLESDYALKSYDSFHGKGDAHMDDGINEKTRGWAAANSYAVRKSPCDERRQRIHNQSKKKSWEQLGRERSRNWGQTRSQSPVRDLKWESYEESEITRNGSGDLSQPQRKFVAGRWRRGSQCRILHRDYLNYSWEKSDIDLAGVCGNIKLHNQGIVLRGMRRSNNGSQKLSRTRSRSQSSVQNSKRESYKGSDRTLSQSRELSKPCRNFAAGRCSRGHHCRSLHQDEYRYKDGRYSEIETAESREIGNDYRQAFSYDNEEVYRDYPRDKASHGYGSSYDEGRDALLKSSSRSTDVCKDFLHGKCHRGSSCKCVHCSSGDKCDRSNRNQPFDNEFKHERTSCKYFATGKCRDGDYCWFSHGSPTHFNSEGQSNDYRWGKDLNDYNITAISGSAKSSGLGNRVKNMDLIDAEVAENSSYNRRGHRLPNGYGTEDERSYRNALLWHDHKREANRFGGTLCKYYAMGKCRHGDQCSLSHDVATHSKAKDKSKYDGWGHDMDDETKLWDGGTWDDIAVVSDAARSTGWGNRDSGNMSCTNALNEKSCNYIRKPKCRSRDGKWAQASDGGKRLSNGARCDDISSISDASKCIRQGNHDVGKVKFIDEKAAENSTYYRPGHSLSSTSGTDYLRSNMNEPRDHNNKPEANESCDTLCKYFATGNCHNGGKCRFSHGGPPLAHRKPKCQSQDGRQSHVSNDGKKLWNGPTWGDVSTVSEAAKSTGWGHTDVRNMAFTNVVAGDSTFNRSLDKISVKEEPESIQVPSQSQKLNGTKDHKTLWNGSTWDDITAVSDASKCTRQGISDAGKMKFTDGMAAENTAYHRPRHKLSDASGNEHLRSNRNAPSDYNHKPESHENGDMLCKYYETRKCLDGDHSRFSQGGFADRKSRCQSRDGRWTHASDVGKKLWNGPKWDDVSAVSVAAKFTGCGHSDVRNIAFTNIVTADSTFNMTPEKNSVKEEPESIQVPSQSQKLNGTIDHKNLRNGLTWDDITAVSDASKCTRQGISDTGKMKFTDGMAARNSTYHRPGRRLSDTSGNAHLKSNRNAPSDYNHIPESHENGDTLCKYFATRKCHDGDRCRFSHGGFTDRKSKCQSRDSGWAHASDVGNNLWNGPRWDDVSAVSEVAKFTGWGHSDVRNIALTNVVTADSTFNRTPENISVKEEPESIQVPSQSQKLSGNNDHKNLWNGSTWDDISAVSDASKCSRQGISDAGKMKFTDGMAAENPTYHRAGHNLSNTSGNEFLRNNRNAPSDYNHRPESHESGDTLCKYCATRKCRDGDRCRFSHGGFADRKSKCQTRDGGWGHVFDVGKKLWTGPRWDDVSAVSQAAKFTGWGNDEVRKMNYTTAAYSTSDRVDHHLDKENRSCGSPVLKDKAAEKDEFSELASESGGAITGDPESMIAANIFVKEEPQTSPVRSQSQNLNGADKPSDWDVMKGTSNLQLGAAVTHSTLSEGSNVVQHFIDGGDTYVVATCSCSQNEVNLSEKIVHTAVVSRQNFKQEGDSLGSELVSSFDESSQDKRILSSNPSISSLYTSHVSGPVQQNVPPFNLHSQMQYQAEYSETEALLKSKIPQVTCGTPLDPVSKPASTTESFLSNSTEEQNGLLKRPNPIEIPKNSSSEQEYHDSLKLKQQQEGGHSENVDADRRVEEGNRNNDEKTLQIFRNALVEVVKEILFPTWKEGRISKDIYKTIVKKVVDKVCGAIQSVHILKTRENINHYLSSFKPNITKLVQDYLEIYPKS